MSPNKYNLTLRYIKGIIRKIAIINLSCDYSLNYSLMISIGCRYRALKRIMWEKMDYKYAAKSSCVIEYI